MMIRLRLRIPTTTPILRRRRRLTTTTPTTRTTTRRGGGLLTTIVRRGGGLTLTTTTEGGGGSRMGLLTPPLGWVVTLPPSLTHPSTPPPPPPPSSSSMSPSSFPRPRPRPLGLGWAGKGKVIVMGWMNKKVGISLPSSFLTRKSTLPFHPHPLGGRGRWGGGWWTKSSILSSSFSYPPFHPHLPLPLPGLGLGLGLRLPYASSSSSSSSSPTFNTNTIPTTTTSIFRMLITYNRYYSSTSSSSSASSSSSTTTTTTSNKMTPGSYVTIPSPSPSPPPPSTTLTPLTSTQTPPPPPFSHQPPQPPTMTKRWGRNSTIQAFWELGRFDKPIGSLLLYLPCTWPLLLSLNLPTTTLLGTSHLLLLFGVGAILLRGAGCIINDLWDRDIDRQVERTKHRPLASGALSPPQALLFLSILLLLGLQILLQLPLSSILLGSLILPLVGIYPLMKRITGYPQLFLGGVFNYGVILGASAVGTLPGGSAALGAFYLGGVCWTMVYDTIYALQDKRDDLRILHRVKKEGEEVGGEVGEGKRKRVVGSTAISFGENVKPYLSLFALLSLSSFTLAGHLSSLSIPYYLITILGSGLHYLHAIWTLKEGDVEDCGRKFREMWRIGGLVALGIFGDWIFVTLFL